MSTLRPRTKDLFYFFGTQPKQTKTYYTKVENRGKTRFFSPSEAVYQYDFTYIENIIKPQKPEDSQKNTNRAYRLAISMIVPGAPPMVQEHIFKMAKINKNRFVLYFELLNHMKIERTNQILIRADLNEKTNLWELKGNAEDMKAAFLLNTSVPLFELWTWIWMDQVTFLLSQQGEISIRASTKKFFGLSNEYNIMKETLPFHAAQLEKFVQDQIDRQQHLRPEQKLTEEQQQMYVQEELDSDSDVEILDEDENHGEENQETKQKEEKSDSEEEQTEQTTLLSATNASIQREEKE